MKEQCADLNHRAGRAAHRTHSLLVLIPEDLPPLELAHLVLELVAVLLHLGKQFPDRVLDLQ